MVELNWMGLTDKQLEDGLIERKHTYLNAMTGEHNNTVLPWAVGSVKALSQELRPLFLDWWKNGILSHDMEVHDIKLSSLIESAPHKDQAVICAFFGMDYAIKHPEDSANIGNYLSDTLG